MYHVTQPYQLVSKTYELCRELAVIETVTHREPFSGFLLGAGERIPREHAAGEVRVELHPTYRGLIELMGGRMDFSSKPGAGSSFWLDVVLPVAEPLVDAVVAALRTRGLEVVTGVFGADMAVELVNDGPVTILLEA